MKSQYEDMCDLIDSLFNEGGDPQLLIASEEYLTKLGIPRDKWMLRDDGLYEVHN